MNYQIVKDEEHLKSFLSWIGIAELQTTESLLVNVSFRSKKLSDEERKALGARNREMYMTKQLRPSRNGKVDIEHCINKFYELEVPVRALTYNIGKPDQVSLPQGALVCYICPNPSLESDVAIEHLISTIDILKNYVHASDKANALDQLAHHNTDFRSERSRLVKKNWIDFDIDLEDKLLTPIHTTIIRTVLTEQCPELHNTHGFILNTSGGFHVLISKECLQGNPENICKKLSKELGEVATVKEVDYKSGGFYVPAPGTLQYGQHTVTFERI